MLRGVNRCAPLERWLGVRLRVRGDSCGAANLAVLSTRYSETSAWCRIWPRWVCILRIFGRRARHLRRKSNDPSPAPHPRTESCAILRTRRRRTDCGSTADRRAPCADGTVIRDRNRLSTALGLSRADVNPATKEIRAAGTKAHTRDRVCRVADWAWPIIWEHIRDRLPVARLFRDDLTRWTVSDWHRETVTSLKLPQYPLRNARDHWAVYRSVLASGWPSFRHS
jgi:hypothetical protein